MGVEDKELVRENESDCIHGSFDKLDIKTKYILSKMRDTIIVLNSERILYVNDAFEEMFGIDKHKFITNPNILYEYIDDEYKYSFFDYNHNKTYDLEIKIKVKSGKGKWIRYKDYYLDINNKKEKLIILSDITAKKYPEKEIERLKLEFFSNISHELKTPLNLIFSSSQLLELKCKKNQISKDIYENYIRIMKQNTLRLLKLINNLIDSTEIDSEHIAINYENKDIINFIENVFNSIEDYAISKNIELIFDTEIEEKVTSFDANKMERALLNILSNAIKFNEDGGKVYLAIRLVDDYVIVHICDTGMGIPNDKINDVFSKFVQVRDRMTKVCEGIGMGLSITKSLIEMQGGSIEVKSTIKKGTEFIIKIPDKIIDKEYTPDTMTLKADYSGLVKKLEIEFSDVYL